MKKRVLSLLAAICLMFASAACGNNTDSSSSILKDKVIEKDENIKTGTEKKIVVGYANLGETIDFSVKVKQGIIEEVSKKGWDLIIADNKLEGAAAVQNADFLITRKVDIVFEFNVDSKVAPAIMQKFNAAKIPVIAIDIPHPGAPFFGANNPEAGKILGRALAAKAKEAWKGKVDLVILVDLPAAGEVVKQRIDNIIAGVRESIQVSDEKIIRVDGKNDVLPAKLVVTDTLIAHPEAKHILIGCLNDQNGSGALEAVQALNREKEVFIASHGCDAPAILNLRGPENCWIGSVAYTPEKYGSYLVPLAEKILKGEEVPKSSSPQHFFVDKNNIDKYYPR